MKRIYFRLIKAGVLRVLLPALALLLLFSGCRQSFDYYNPLDPSEDASLAEILPFIEDPVIRNAINSTGAQSKSELGWLWVDGFDHGGNVTTAAGMEFLSYTTDLTLVNVGLPDSLTGDLGSLARMRSLHWLDLNANSFTELNLDTIPHIPSLEGLSLDGNQITDAGGVVPLLQDYRRGQLSLNIGWNNMDASTLGSLNPVLDRLHELRIAGLDEFGPALDLSFLPSNDTIYGLGIESNTGTGDLVPLERLSELRWLNISDTNLDEFIFSSMPFIPDLYYINLSRNQFTDLWSVESFLSSYERGRMNVDIGDNPYGAGALDALVPVMDRLHGLGLQYFESIGPLTDLYFLPTNDTINRFNVTGHDLSDIWAISRLRGLEYLEMENNGAGFVSGSEALLDLPELREIWVTNSPGIEQWVLDELRSRGVDVYQ